MDVGVEVDDFLSRMTSSAKPREVYVLKKALLNSESSKGLFLCFPQTIDSKN